MTEWFSVKDRLPDDMEIVAYICKDGTTGFSRMLKSYVEKYGNPCEVIYWYPVLLPEPPKEEEK